jgi:hypothetical protein
MKIEQELGKERYEKEIIGKAGSEFGEAEFVFNYLAKKGWRFHSSMPSEIGRETLIIFER